MAVTVPVGGLPPLLVVTWLSTQSISIIIRCGPVPVNLPCAFARHLTVSTATLFAAALV